MTIIPALRGNECCHKGPHDRGLLGAEYGKPGRTVAQSRFSVLERARATVFAGFFRMTPYQKHLLRSLRRSLRRTNLVFGRKFRSSRAYRRELRQYKPEAPPTDIISLSAQAWHFSESQTEFVSRVLNGTIPSASS